MKRKRPLTCLEDAEALKNEGNSKYQQGLLVGALQCYSTALTSIESVCDDNDMDDEERVLATKLRSNLSAVNFEAGQYSQALDCAESVLKASGVEPPLRKKIQIRKERASAYLRSASQEVHRPWLPRYRPSRLNASLEMYSAGHDPARSYLRNTEGGQVFDVAVSGDADFSVFFGGCGDCRHYMVTLIDAHGQFSRLNSGTEFERRFSISHLSNSHGSNDEVVHQKSLQFVLNDIHPYVLPRLLLIMHLASQLVELVSGQDVFESLAVKGDARDVATLLHYLYLSPIMPPRLFSELLIPTLKYLISLTHEPEILQRAFGVSISHEDIQSLTKVWTKWSKQKLPTADRVMRAWKRRPANDHECMAMARQSSSLQDMLKTRESEVLEQMRSFVDHESDENLESLKAQFPGGESMTRDEFKMFVASTMKETGAFDPFGDTAFGLDGDPRFGCTAEEVFTDSCGFLPPPGAVLGCLADLGIRAECQASNSGEVQRSCLTGLAQSGKTPKLVTQKLQEQVSKNWGNAKNWKYNVTCYDLSFLRELGYDSSNLELQFDPFEIVRDLYFGQCNEKNGDSTLLPLPPVSTELFNWTSYFFWLLGCALKSFKTPRLITLPGGEAMRFTVRTFCMHGDYSDCLDKLSYQLTWPVPVTDTPCKPFHFDCISLSNVPDYSGFLPVLTSAAPALKSEGSKISCNVLLNTGMWEGYDSYIYNGSYLNLKRGDVEVLFGLRSLNTSAWEDHEWSQLSSRDERVVHRGVTKQHVKDALINILLHLLLPCRSPLSPHARIRATIPMNSSNFFRVVQTLLEHHSMPPHWVDELMEEILENKLKTKMRPPSQHPPKEVATASLPPVCHLDLRFALVELRTLAACYNTKGAFATCHTRGLLPEFQSIKQYRLSDMQMSPALFMGNPRAAVLGLAILTTSQERGNRNGPFDLKTALDAKFTSTAVCANLPRYAIAASSVQPSDGLNNLHLLSVISYNSAENCVEFRMHQADFDREAFTHGALAVLFDYSTWMTVSDPKLLRLAAEVI